MLNNETATQAAIRMQLPIFTMQSRTFKKGGTWHDNSKWVTLYDKDADGNFKPCGIGAYTLTS